MCCLEFNPKELLEVRFHNFVMLFYCYKSLCTRNRFHQNSMYNRKPLIKLGPFNLQSTGFETQYFQ
ncbi:hypothetical protein MtrunA17_Chr1g0181161 [Medicago truncatula]|uniref:Uncharacterized protein n=1 Tax=Medicago truncatula TaxID=3880 RepID=A0A396JNA7_MEDTR|nr:hypothetical protein MtrunA17_Chr1g0181161 [Medicago truncatula]